MILGPSPAPVTRLRGYHRYHMLVFAGRQVTLGQLIQDATKAVKFPDEVQWIVDVDPLDMM